MVVQVSERVWVAPGGVNVGIIRADVGRFILVDTGLNDTSAKKVLKAVREELNGDVVAIITTHGHADHFGGNAAIVKRTDAQVWAPRIDEAVLRYPILQPALLYGGADPIETMRGGFMLADASPVDHVFAPGPLAVEGVAMDAIDLAGHSPGQVGILIDDVFFCADVVLPETVLEKYRIPYLYGVTDHLTALDRAETIPATTVVPGHGPILESIAPVAAANRALVLDVLASTRTLTKQPTTADAVLTGLLRQYGSPAADAPGFYLLQPTAFAFLTHLHRSGEVTHEVSDGQALWTAVSS